MDKTDQKLLAELDKDPRIPLTQLAKKLLISQQVADYRMKRMLKDGIISKFGTIINLKALRQEPYRVFFTFNAKKEYALPDVFQYLRDQKGVYWVARIGGKYDLLVVLFVKDFEAFDQFIDCFNQKFPNLIKDYKSCYVTAHLVCRHKYLSKDYSCLEYGYNDPLQDIDNLDRYILSKIKDNCRLSSLELSKEKNVSYKTIISHIKSLEKNKIIVGYRIFIKSEQYRPFMVLLSFKSYTRDKEKTLLSFLGTEDHITQTVRMFGIWNLLLHIRIEDPEKLQNLIIELRDKFDIIDNYEIIPVFEDVAINLMPL